MTGTDNQARDHLEHLAELARANVSGPLGRKLIIKAQHDLVNTMKKKGLINEEDASDLKM